MHEASIVAGLIDAVARATAGFEGVSVKTIEITVGRLRAVEPALLVGCFELFRETTPFADAELICREAPVAVVCESCGAHEELHDLDLRCSACSSRTLTVVGGRELRIEKILVG